MKNLKFGVGIFASNHAEEAVDLAVLAEEAGYDTLWVGDSHMIWRELYVLMGCMAARTNRVWISPGVTQLITRHSTVTASALITLSELTGGRVQLGLGLGDSSVKNLGEKSASLSTLKEGIELIRRLCEGQKVRMNDREGSVTFASGLKIPIYIASISDRVLDYAGRVADGVILTGDSAALRSRIEAVRNAQQQTHRSIKDVKVVWWRACCISEDDHEAREAVKPMVARGALSELGRRAKHGQELNEEEREVLGLLEKNYDFYHHMGPEHSRWIPDGWVDRYALAGSPTRVLARIQEMLQEGQEGIDEIAIIPFAMDRKAVVKLFSEGVIKALKGDHEIG